MARIRSIHAGFFTDEAFTTVSAFARLLLLGLGIEADDKGVFPWKPLTFKMRILPMDVVDIQELLAELVSVDAIRKFRAEDGKDYGVIRNFLMHQKPKSPNDLYPLPDDLRDFLGNSEALEKRFGNGSLGGEGRGEEGKGEERRGGERKGGSSRAGATPFPDDFEPVLTDRAQAIVERWKPGELETQLSRFKDHHTAKGSTFKDWQAAFRTWIDNHDEYRQRNGKTSGRSSSGPDRRSGIAKAVDRQLGID